MNYYLVTLCRYQHREVKVRAANRIDAMRIAERMHPGEEALSTLPAPEVYDHPTPPTKEV